MNDDPLRHWDPLKDDEEWAEIPWWRKAILAVKVTMAVITLVVVAQWLDISADAPMLGHIQALAVMVFGALFLLSAVEA